MNFPKPYCRFIRKYILSFFLSLSFILALSSYYQHHQSVSHTQHSSSLSLLSSVNKCEKAKQQYAINVDNNNNNNSHRGNKKEKSNKVEFIREKKISKVITSDKHQFSDKQMKNVISYPVAKRITQNHKPILRMSSESRPTQPMKDSTATNKSGEIFKYRYAKTIDPLRKSKVSWHHDPECQNFRVYFTKMGKLPFCALASYPGSGNTWTRRLLEDASGIFTGSIYSDQQLFVNGFYGELEPWTSGTTIAQKTHDCGPDHINAFNKTAILLLRNPYRAILSFHNYLFAGHTGFAPMSNYRRKDWGKFVHLQAKSWLEMAINWTTQSDPHSLTVLHYEHLQEDPVPHLERTLKNLGHQPDALRMKCLKKFHSYKTFKRKEEFVPDNLQMFSKADRDKIDRAIRYVDYLLRKRGQPPLPMHLYEFYNYTTPTHITSVSCLKLESEAACDQRVDTLNNVRLKKKLHNFDQSTPEEDKGAVIKIKHTRKNSLDKFVSTNVGNMLTNLFVTIASSLKHDPITLIFGEESTIRLQHRNLQLETNEFPEAKQLMFDFRARVLR